MHPGKVWPAAVCVKEARLLRCALLGVMAFTFSVLPAGPGRAQTVSAATVDDVERYLDDLHTLRARFIQIAPDGSSDQGEIWLKRPGLLKLDYDQPSKIEMYANNGRLIYYDPDFNQLNYIGLDETPLGFLLAEDINLREQVDIERLELRADELIMVVSDADSDIQGQLELVFAREPLQLKRWTVVDPQGYRTLVMLEDVRTGMPLDNELFRFINPRLLNPSNQ